MKKIGTVGVFSALLLSFFIVLFTAGKANFAFADPTGGLVASGNVTISSAPGSTQIHQSSDKAVINWDSFNIGVNEKAQFFQPSSSAIALNRINAFNGTSNILGSIIANGQVWLLNPAGIFFGPTANIDVSGLLATTANITDEDFMAGRYNFTQDRNATGSIINAGKIRVTQGGTVVLAAPGVENRGIIEARLGKVALGAGNDFTIDFYGDKLINFTTNTHVEKPALDEKGRPMKNGVSNSGKILADGGRVLLTAQMARNVVNNVVNTSGVIRAQGVEQHNGEIILTGGDQGVVSVSGKLDVSSKKSGQTGGKITILGENVGLFGQAQLLANGDAGGGQILIGGNAYGAGPEMNASRVYVAPDVKISANALTSGDGGKVVVWSDEGTRFYGNISVQGGALSGNGGWVETSSKNFLDVNGSTVDARAPHGTTGTWLLDPTNIYIASNQANATAAGMSGTDDSADTSDNPFTASGAVQDSFLSTTTLTSALATANVIVTTTNASGSGFGNITVVNPITWSSAQTLTLTAANNIALNATITTGAVGSALILNAAGNVTQTAIIAGSGSLVQQGAGTTTLNQSNTYSGGTSITGGTLVATTLAATGSNSSIGRGALSIDTGGIFSYTGSTVSTNRAITVGSGGGTIQITNAASRTLTLTGGISNSGALTFDTTGAGAANITVSTTAISGTGSLIKTGANTLTLGVANTYTGATTVSGGTLTLSNVNALGSGGTQSSSTTVASGATLNMSFATNTLGNTNLIKLSGAGVGGAGALIGSTGTDTLSNPITLEADTTIGGTNNLVLSGAISGTGFGLTKVGANTITLGGSNTFTGATLINSGTLSLTNINALGSGLMQSSGTTVASGATLNVGYGTGTTLANTNTITLSGQGVGNVGALTSSVSTDIISNNITLAADTYIGGSSLTLTGIISGGFGLTKVGANTLTLSGLNTYTGATTISAGTLSVNTLANAGSNSSLGTGTGNATISIGNTAILLYTGAGSSSTRPIALTGAAGTITASGTGALILGGGITGTGSSTLTLSGTATGANASIQSGVIDSTIAGLTKSAAGTWILSGNNAYGTTTITTGTLQIGNGVDTGTLGSGAVSNAGTLTFNRNNPITVNNAISGAGGLIQAGTGILTLGSTSNTYSGATTINAGTLKAGGANTLSPNSSVILASGAVLDLNDFNNTIKSLAGVAGSSVTLGNVTGGTLTIGGATATFSGSISGLGGLTINNAGFTQTLGGANTYTGSTLINSGTLSLTNINALGTGVGSQSIDTTVASGATLNVGYGTGSTLTNNRTITLSGQGVGNAGALTSSVSTDIISNNITLAADTYIGGSSLTLTGIITGGFGLTKVGANTLTLGGSNTYTGATTVNTGTLTLTNANALGSGVTQSSGTTVASGAALTMNFSTGTLGNTNTITLSGTGVGGTGALVGSTSTDILTNAIVLAANTTIGGAGNLILNGGISGGFGLTKAGANTLTLGGSNTYTGATAITAGTLTLTNANALGSGVTQSSGTTVSSGAALNLNFSTGTLGNTNTITLSGTGVGATGALVGSTSTDTLSNNIVLAANTTIGGTGNVILNGPISGAFNLTKAGGNTITLGGSNTLYTGLTTVNAGILSITNAAGLGDTATGTTINSGGTLQINGVAVGNEAITLNNGGILQGTGTASLGGNITLAGTLGTSRTISTLLSGDAFTLNGTINGAAPLILNGPGSMTLDGVVGGTTALSSITSNVGGILTINSGSIRTSGAQTYNSILALGNNTTFTVTAANADILITNTSNNIANTITYATEGAGTIRDITLANAASGAVIPSSLPTSFRNLILNFSNASTSINLPGMTLTGLLTATAGGSITQSGALAIAGVTTLTAGSDITLSNTSNNFSTIGVSGANATFTDSGTVILGTSTLTGILNVTAGGTITQSGVLSGTDLIVKTQSAAASNITLGSLANNFNTIDLQTLNLAGTSPVAGAITYQDSNSIQINRINTSSGAITVTAGGNITEGSGANTGITSTGITTLIAGANDITLNNTANNFGTLAITTGRNVSVTDTSGIVLGTSNISGTFDLTAGGTISQSGTATTLTITGTPTFTVTAPNSDILLGNANAFTATPVFLTSDSGSIRDLTLHNTLSSATMPALPTGLRNLSLTFDAADMTFASNLSLTGTLTAATGTAGTTGGMFTIANGVAVSTNNTAINITAVDVNLLGSLNSGTAATTITEATAGSSLGVGNVLGAAMTISGAELQRITAGSLSLAASSNGQIIVDGVASGDLANIAGTTTLTATAGTTGSISFTGSSSSFPRLTINTDTLLTVASNVTVSTNNAALSITAADINLQGFLNSGTAATTITQNTAGGSIGLGNTAGTMTIGGDELQRISAGSLSLVAPSNGQIIVDGITAANSANIAGTTTLTATAGTTGSISFSGGSSSFSRALTINTDTLLTVASNVTISTSNAALSITASDIDLSGALNSGTATTTITQATAGGSIGLGTTGTMTISNDELQRITTGNLSLTTTGGNILVNTVTAPSTISAISLTAMDIDISGAFNAGNSLSLIQSNTTPGVIGLGNATGSMTISNAELQNITVGTLNITTGSGGGSTGTIVVDGVSTPNTITGVTTLTSTAGTTGSVTFQTANSNFRNGVTVSTDNAVTLNDGITLSTTNAPISLVAASLNMNSTGALNAGAGDITIRGNSGQVDVGDFTAVPGEMQISHSMLQRMTAANLTIANTGGNLIQVDNVALADTAGITGTVTFDATNANASTITFQGNASSFKTLTAITQGTININTPVSTTVGNLVLTASTTGDAGPINLSANLTSAGSMTLTAGADTPGTHQAGINLVGAPITLSGNGVTIASELNGAQDLVINSSSGAVTFTPVGSRGVPTTVGLVTPLASLTINGSTNINITNIQTTGAQTYNGPVTLGSNLTLTATTGGDINLANTVSGAFSLAVNTAGVTTFGGVVNGLTTITTDAPGSVAINAGSITTTGAQTYNDAATIGADTTIDASGTNITFGNTINSASSSAKSLTLTGGAGTISIGGVIGGTNPLNNFTETLTGNILISNSINTVGNITLTSGGTIQQSGAVVLNGGLLTTSSVGGTALNNSNTLTGFNATNTGSGNITLTNSGALAIAGVNQTGGGSVTIVNSGALTLNGAISVTGGTGNTIVLSGTQFTNNAGASALSPGAGNNFLVWSGNPANDNRGGIAYNFKQYDATYGVTPVAGTGSGFLYTLAPIATPVLTGTVSKVYDATTNATLSAGNYSALGAVDGDTVVFNNPTSGFYDTKNTGVDKNVSVTGIAISTVTSDGVPVYGYQLGSSSANANIGEITPASLTITADSGQSKVYGSNDPDTGFTYTESGLFSGDTLSGNLGRVAGENVSTYEYNSGSLTAGSNYTMNVSGAFSITPAPLTITAIAGQSKVYGSSDSAEGFTYSSTGLMSGVAPKYWNSAGQYVEAATINDNVTGKLGRDAGENIGTYTYNPGSFSTNSNYTTSFTSSTFTIKPAALAIIPTSGQSKVEGSPDPVFAYTSPGLVSGVTPSYWNSEGQYVNASAINDSFNGALSRVAGQNVGNYNYLIGNLVVSNQNNYIISFIPGTFAITPGPYGVSPAILPIIYQSTASFESYFIPLTPTVVPGWIFTNVWQSQGWKDAVKAKITAEKEKKELFK